MEFNPLAKTLVPLLRQTLTAYSARHTAAAENIANVETKGFRPLKVHFEDALQRALEPNKPGSAKTHEKHMNFSTDVSSVGYRVEEMDASVNLEQEMAELAQNQIKYDFAVRALKGNYDKIKMAIRGRLG
jgi:flagellar basal-body rod protein FlgB